MSFYYQLIIEYKPSHLNAEITTDGARLGVCRVGFPQHYSPSFNYIESFPYLKIKTTKILLNQMLMQNTDNSALLYYVLQRTKVLPLKILTLPRLSLGLVKVTRGKNIRTGSNCKTLSTLLLQ